MLIRRNHIRYWLVKTAKVGAVSLVASPAIKAASGLSSSRLRFEKLKALNFYTSGVLLGLVLAGLPLARRWPQRSTLKHVGSQQQRRAEVVLVSSNGAGLGHLTRLMAIKLRLQQKSVIYTLSEGYKRLGLPQGELQYFPSSGSLHLSSRVWNQLLADHFSSFLAVTNPRVVVFDGTYVYKGIVESCQALGIPLVWLQRGLWKQAVDLSSFQRPYAHKFVDYLLIPSETAVEENVKDSAVKELKRVSPIVVTKESEILSTAEAKKELNLDPAKKHVLVQLGAGRINDIDSLRTLAIECVRELGDGWVAVVPENPLKALPTESGVETIEAYPMAQYFRAFEFAIFAAGYNSVQESVAVDLPAIFIPNLDTQTDDQKLRASALQDAGLGLFAADNDGLRHAVAQMGNETKRRQIRTNLRAIPYPCGADEAAEWLESTFL